MANNTLGTINVELRANTAGFVGDLGKASRAAQQLGKDISTSFNGLARIASQTFGAFGPLNQSISTISTGLSSMGRAAADAAKSLSSINPALGVSGAVGAAAATGLALAASSAISLTVHTAESAAKFYDLSKSTGVSVEALTGLTFAAKIAGVEQETLVRGLEQMSRTAFASANGTRGAVVAYRDLAVQTKNADGSIRSAEQIFVDVADRLSRMKDGVVKTAFEMQIFGRTGAGLAPLLSLTREELEHWLDVSQKVGYTLTGATAKAAHAFTDETKLLGLEVDGLSNKLMQQLLPALTFLATKLADGLGDPNSALNGWISKVGELAKDMLSLADTALTTARVMAAPVNLALHPTQVKEYIASIQQALEANNKFRQSLFAPPTPAPLHTAAGGTRPPDDAAIAAAKKLSETLDQLNAKYQEVFNTAGKGAGATEDYRLHVLGATAAQIAFNAALRDTAHQAQLQADILSGKVKVNPPTIPDKTKQLSVGPNGEFLDGLQKETLALQTQQAAIDANVLSTERLKSANADLFAGIVAGDPLQQKITANVNALSDAINESIKNWGKSTEQIAINNLAASGATTEQIAHLTALNAKLQDLENSSKNVSGVWKQIGDTIASDFAKMVTSTEKPLQALKSMVLGIFKEIEQTMIKSLLFGNGSKTGSPGSSGLFGDLGNLFRPTFSPGSTGGGSSSGGGLGGIFGKLFGLGGVGGGIRDGSIASRAMYVTPTDDSGTVLSAQILADANSQSLSPVLSSSLAPLTNLSNELAGVLGGGDGASGGGAGGLGLGSLATGLLGLIPGLASGGPVTAGSPYVVGDGGGPELFVPDAAGKVVPLSAAASPGVVINYVIDARGATDPAATAAAIQSALKQTENRAVARAIEGIKQSRLRNPTLALQP